MMTIKKWWARQDINRNVPEHTEAYFNDELNDITRFQLWDMRRHLKAQTFMGQLPYITLGICLFLFGICCTLMVMMP